MAGRKYRVVHCGTGPTGRLGLIGIDNHPDLDLVGHLVFDPAKVGQDSGDICRMDRKLGVLATDDQDALIALKPDMLVFLGDGIGHLKESVDTICKFLSAGINVGTAALYALTNPRVGPPEYREAIEKACEEGQSSYYFSGIDPGFASPWLAVAMLKNCDEVSEVRMQELADYGKYPVEWIMREVYGFGQPKDYKCLLSEGTHAMTTWQGTVTAVADRMGIELERLEAFYYSETHDVGHQTLWGPVDAGTVAAVRFGVEGYYKGKPFIVLEHVNRTTPAAAPHWPQPKIDQEKGLDHQYTVLISGDPGFEIRWDIGRTRSDEDAGLVATAMLIVNAVPIVTEHAPGWINEMDLPLYTARNIKV
ncbi:hypothetical protein GGR39_002118 [Novosphingobium fluoreni]|uniref:2,4-diaminopentanoate dehydrogenase C-terminal domain-containing protein n=1 Tax=Novosphingobium fluoreni TaxID=1391222 RepID=A0A7W6BYX0_9SPHN|nr:dihydrodipicolinate reductase [Novosphingobium fluoreni]MBB3940461.1 hypothetical protein [Novosphingobium fluoreni]